MCISCGLLIHGKSCFSRLSKIEWMKTPLVKGCQRGSIFLSPGSGVQFGIRCFSDDD